MTFVRLWLTARVYDPCGGNIFNPSSFKGTALGLGPATLALMLVASPALAEPPGNAKSGNAKSGDAKLSDAKSGDAKPEGDAAPPKTRSWTIDQRDFSYNLEFRPGVPNPGQMVEIIVSVARIPSTPHPTYGHRIPVSDARFVLEMSAPGGRAIGRYRAHPLPLTRGRYGIHFTPTAPGLYGLRIRGQSSKNDRMEAETKLPVAVWPLPKDLRGTGDATGRRRRGPIAPLGPITPQ
ncbi:MAG: hypothetical protein AAFN74_10475 [Myxococcota bacterium]